MRRKEQDPFDKGIPLSVCIKQPRIEAGIVLDKTESINKLNQPFFFNLQK